MWNRIARWLRWKKQEQEQATLTPFERSQLRQVQERKRAREIREGLARPVYATTLQPRGITMHTSCQERRVVEVHDAVPDVLPDLSHPLHPLTDPLHIYPGHQPLEAPICPPGSHSWGGDGAGGGAVSSSWDSSSSWSDSSGSSGGCDSGGGGSCGSE